ncbi:nitrite reductase small subunit NirD [Halobacillus mangrovi]|uniref:Nitrite reductase (NAD(P)H) small subunit n=1 Tax=Halobacillus mangrovi TaxID=402384 RepID=A0A1W5ZTK8_9BACI|nr:nitrite reductase small subunit NirD [Halobacillus mangrovi]ARI76603.1 nitrite reductase (NAD(P)H) small subunit [Halobacillus mangrovi]
METLLNEVFVAKVEDLPEKIGKTTVVGDLELAIFKLDNGKVHAIENRCPHKGGVLAEGLVSGEHVFCPMHDWKISVKNGKVQEPDVGCVQTFEVAIKNEEVYVLLPE